MPRLFVFSTNNMHVQYASQLLELVEAVMQMPHTDFVMSLFSINDEHSDDVLVTVGAVISMAKIISTLAHTQTITTQERSVSLVLAFELGRLNGMVQSGRDRIVILSNDENIVHTFHNTNVRGATITVISLPSHLTIGDATTR